ncbi:hypothetical protein LXL04_002340 [Taraxacum kok-saghyz]
MTSTVSVFTHSDRGEQKSNWKPKPYQRTALTETAKPKPRQKPHKPQPQAMVRLGFRMATNEVVIDMEDQNDDGAEAHEKIQSIHAPDHCHHFQLRLPNFLPPELSYPQPNSQPPITMSEQQQIVEHVVLFKVKPDADSSKVAAMISGLNGLASLDLTLHLSFGQLLHSRPSPLTFTHMLHSGYRSKDDLRAYAVHPEHVRVVNENKPILDDVMAVDWMSNAGSSISPKPGSAMRVTILKLKENLGEDGKARVLEVIGGIKDEFQAIEEVSMGENFSHDRAKGYTIASIVVLPGQADLEAVDSNSELVNLQKEKIGDSIESTVVVDYVIPPPLVA